MKAKIVKFIIMSFINSSSIAFADLTPMQTPQQSVDFQNSSCSTIQITPAIDVSDHQPSTDWGQVHSGGIGIAIIKATEGVTFTNPSFSNDWSQAVAAGIIRGAYHYFRPSDDPNEQVKFFLNTISNTSGPILPPIFDWEETDGVPNDLIIQRAAIWLEAIVASTGMTPIIYTDPTYWKALGSPAGFDKYPLFIADYGVDCPEVPAPWKSWALWQRGIGKVSGVTASVDLDVVNWDFYALLMDL